MNNLLTRTVAGLFINYLLGLRSFFHHVKAHYCKKLIKSSQNVYLFIFRALLAMAQSWLRKKHLVRE